MTAYYNEFDPYAAQWLRNLIAAGHLPAGVVDERSIAEVCADDLAGFDQCHLFAGVGGWPLALRLAGWPDDRPVWTGSCPCQPLSSAGQRKGHADERHLWPTFYNLISQRRPSEVFGEQVASKDGREWLAGVRADLENVGYAVGAADLCAAGIGAPHIRQRLYWVADAKSRQGERGQPRVLPDAWTPFDTWDTPRGAVRVVPRSKAVAHGLSNSVGFVRAFGNAIVPQLGAQFVSAYMEAA